MCSSDSKEGDKMAAIESILNYELLDKGVYIKEQNKYIKKLKEIKKAVQTGNADHTEVEIIKQNLKKAGILDSKGEISEIYRKDEDLTNE